MCYALVKEMKRINYTIFKYDQNLHFCPILSPSHHQNQVLPLSYTQHPLFVPKLQELNVWWLSLHFHLYF